LRYRLVSLLFATCLAASAQSNAEPSETDRSLAQSLFEQGKRLMDGGNFEHACPKLEESQRLDPRGGTLLNLALCHERQGKIATAWTDFKGALSAARRDGRQDRITAAEEHIAALEPKLPWLTLTATGVVEGEEIKLDGAAVGRAAWGSPVSIDPGAHELRATAPGRKPWSLALTIAIGEKRTVTIPALEADPNQAAPAAGSAAAPRRYRLTATGARRVRGARLGGSSEARESYPSG
jgi:tetratricopeptide (TPR) repeat protein